MINLRYHIVSLTAVFLALAIGVIAGATVVPEPLIRELRGARTSLEANRAELRARVAGLDRQVAMWERFGEQRLGSVAGALAGVPVVQVVVGGPTKELRARIDATLKDASAIDGGTVVLGERWVLKEDRARDALGVLLARPTRDVGDLWRAGSERLAARLREQADPRRETDLLRMMDDEGFVRLEDIPTGVFPPPGAVLLIVSGGDRDVGAPVDPFVAGLAQGLTAAKAVIAEPIVTLDPGVESLRAIVEVWAGIGTIDHVDSVLGRYSLIAALASEATGSSSVHLGIGERATALSPSGGFVRPRRPASPSPTPSRS